jgi:hypothetical protein
MKLMLQNKNNLKPKFEAGMHFQTSACLKSRLQIFGDEYAVKFVRLILEVDSKEETEDFINKHLHKVQTSLEVFISIIQQFPFKFNKLPGTTNIFISYGEFDEANNKPLEITPVYRQVKLNYDALKFSLAGQFPGLESYLVYLQRGMDTRLDWDYRWINYYKICELRFNSKGDKLIKSENWRLFLNRFNHELKPFLKSKQSFWGLIEEWRVLAYHSIGEGGKVNFGNPFDSSAAKKLIETLPIMQKFAHTIINELPGNKNLIFNQNGEVKMFKKDE